MAFFDMPLEQLREYRPELAIPADFDSFWADTLTAARDYPLDARYESTDNRMMLVETFDVTFNGYGGQPIKAWLTLPRHREGPLPCVVEYIGYGGGRGLPWDHLLWANAGYAHLLMDTRGQGSSWRQGDTADIPDGANPSLPGFMTQGVLNPQTYYYRRVFTDGVRAVEAARQHPAVDANRIVVAGGSQGGGICIAVAALTGDVQALMPNVPFLCGYRRAISIVDTNPYYEITRFLSIHRTKAERVWNTLAYFDGTHFATKISAPALFSVALMDTICPSSTVFGAYNHLASAHKQISVYEYNQHEGGASHHVPVQLDFLRELWG